uniref:Uncharacterized protein n=1 Tax=Rhizophora mucronata TaxID=61149 RepID=A0A2P2QBY7_RHIMU
MHMDQDVWHARIYIHQICLDIIIPEIAGKCNTTCHTF